MWDIGMTTLIICFTIIGTKKTRFKVRVRNSSSIKELKDHLKAGRGVEGRLRDKKLSDNVTLAEAGIITDTVLEVESFRTPKRFTHNISVKVIDGEDLNVQVHQGTTAGELKHKLQDETGMPVEEQILEYNGRVVNQGKIVVKICRHKKTPIVLKWHRRHGMPQQAGAPQPRPPSNSSIDLLAKKPTPGELTLIRSQRGEVRIIEAVAPQWKDLAALLEFDGEGQTLQLIQATYQAPVDCCREMFLKWLQGRGQKPTWKVLIELLNDMQQSELANQVKAAIESKYLQLGSSERPHCDLARILST